MFVSTHVMAACPGPLSLAENELDQTVVVLFGDSITVGYNDNYPVANGSGTITKGCPTIFLHQILDEVPKRSNVVSNWGVGGSNTGEGASRIISDLNFTANAYPAKAYYVLILYGTNDQSFGISTSTTGFNIRVMIQRARLVGYEPIVGTLTPRTDRDVVPYNIKIIANANLESAFIVDHYARFTSDPNWPNTLMDSTEPANKKLHPSDAGYLVIAETWFNERLEDIIESDPLPPLVLAGVLYLLLSD